MVYRLPVCSFVLVLPRRAANLYIFWTMEIYCLHHGRFIISTMAVGDYEELLFDDAIHALKLLDENPDESVVLPQYMLSWARVQQARCSYGLWWVTRSCYLSTPAAPTCSSAPPSPSARGALFKTPPQ